MYHNIDSEVLAQLKIESPIGDLFTQATMHGVCTLSFERPDNWLDDKEESYDPAINFLSALKMQLDKYFNKENKEFHLPLDLKGTNFQKTVWMSLQDIPFGKTRTYLQQAQFLGNPLSIRAVAHANGKNPIAVVIPCHRVIGSRGELTGYAGGLWRKQWLLEHEQNVTGQMMIEGFRNAGK